jgi:hypothetical protein
VGEGVLFQSCRFTISQPFPRFFTHPWISAHLIASSTTHPLTLSHLPSFPHVPNLAKISSTREWLGYGEAA